MEIYAETIGKAIEKMNDIKLDTPLNEISLALVVNKKQPAPQRRKKCG